MATDYAVITRPEVADQDVRTSVSLGPLDLAKFLLGRRDVILQVAQSRSALWLGLLFVLSAGLAREYDGADLLHEPWHLVLPLGASLVTSFLLYCLIFLAALNRGVRELPFAGGYQTLLAFYWWTGPLAWIYAIPVERFLSPADATTANLWFLAAVSVWRVLLMTRVLSVWLSASFIGVFFIVMLFAEGVLLLATMVTPIPIWDVMGGIRLSKPDAAVLNAVLTVTVLGAMTSIVWLVGACLVIGRSRPQWSLPAAESMPAAYVAKSLWFVGVALIAIGVALLPLGQPEQQHRWQAEKLLQSGELTQAVMHISRFDRDDFPPIWDPPPRVGYGEEMPSPLDVLSAAERNQSPEWVRVLYAEKLSQNPRRAFENVFLEEGEADTTEFDRVMSVFEKYVPAESLDQSQVWDMEYLLAEKQLDEERRARLRAYLDKAENRAQ